MLPNLKPDAPAEATSTPGSSPSGGNGSQSIVRDSTRPIGWVQGREAAPPNPKPRGRARRGRDAHLGLRFWVQLGQIEIAGFRECSGLEIKTETIDYNEGGLNEYAHRLPVRMGYSNITLKRGMEFTLGDDLYSWYYDASQGIIRRQNISIVLYSNSVMQGEDNMLVRDIVQRWDLRNAFPCRWTGPEMNAERGAIAIETLEIAHEGLLPTSSPKERLDKWNKPGSPKESDPRKKWPQFY